LADADASKLRKVNAGPIAAAGVAVAVVGNIVLRNAAPGALDADNSAARAVFEAGEGVLAVALRCKPSSRVSFSWAQAQDVAKARPTENARMLTGGFIKLTGCTMGAALYMGYTAYHN
jgi:hypothetical protein